MKCTCLMGPPLRSGRIGISARTVACIALVWAMALLVFNPALPALAEEGMGVMGGGPSKTHGASPFGWGDPDLDEAVEKLVAALTEQGNLKGQPVMISPHDLYDAQTGLCLPLANQLRGKLITEMKKAGVRVLLQGADEERFVLVQGTWQKQGKDLAIDLKVMKLDPRGPEAVASASGKVALAKVDAGALTPDRESWARYLIRRLEQNTGIAGAWRVHMRDFQVKARTCSPELGPYLAGWLRPGMAESRMFVLLDPQKALQGLPVTTLRTRGTRAIRPERPRPEDETSLTADLLKADGELRGEVWLHEGKLEVRARVIGRDCQQITAASADIPSGLFPQELLQPPSTPVAPPRDAPTSDTGAISKDGLKLELTTTRGEERPVYHANEQIRFLIRINRPAWIYLFDLDPHGNATLLYPVDETGRLARGGQCGAPPQPGALLVLPEDGCSYHLMATEPYGKDRVWAVAAESALQFPADLGGDWKWAHHLVKALRDQGLSQKRGYAEAEVEVVTGP